MGAPDWAPVGGVSAARAGARGEVWPARASAAAAAGAARLALTHFSSRYASTAGHVAEAGGAHGDVVALADFDRVAVR